MSFQSKMINTLKMRPLAGDRYLVLSGESSMKEVSMERVHGKMEQVTPVAYIETEQEGDPLKNSEVGEGLCSFDIGNIIGKQFHGTIAMRVRPYEVKTYRKGKLVVFSMDSDLIIQAYRALRIISALPSIDGKDLGDVRDAQRVVQGESSIHDVYGPKLIPVMRSGMKMLARLFSRESTLPVRHSNWMIPRGRLEEILGSFPTDSRGRKIKGDGKTDLVLTASVNAARYS